MGFIAQTKDLTYSRSRFYFISATFSRFMLETRGISIVLLLAPFEEYTVAVIIPAEEKAGVQTLQSAGSSFCKRSEKKGWNIYVDFPLLIFLYNNEQI